MIHFPLCEGFFTTVFPGPRVVWQWNQRTFPTHSLSIQKRYVGKNLCNLEKLFSFLKCIIIARNVHKNNVLHFFGSVNGELQRVTVASLTPLEDSSHYDITFNEGETPATVWPNGVPPDGTPIQVEHFPYPALMGIVYTYSLLGVLFALGCLAFNLVFRKRKLVFLLSVSLGICKSVNGGKSNSVNRLGD